jgi:hypothetical protein
MEQESFKPSSIEQIVQLHDDPIECARSLQVHLDTIAADNKPTEANKSYSQLAEKFYGTYIGRELYFTASMASGVPDPDKNVEYSLQQFFKAPANYVGELHSFSIKSFFEGDDPIIYAMFENFSSLNHNFQRNDFEHSDRLEVNIKDLTKHIFTEVLPTE